MFRTLLTLLSLVGVSSSAVGISGMGTSQLAGGGPVAKISAERYVAMVCFRVKSGREKAFEAVRRHHMQSCSVPLSLLQAAAAQYPEALARTL